MAALRDRIWAALDYQFRSAADIARRAGVDATSAAPALGHLRQHGAVESRRDGTKTLWRRWPARTLGRSPI
jgi:DNA-binding transcriptional ArsR family regulator